MWPARAARLWGYVPSLPSARDTALDKDFFNKPLSSAGSGALTKDFIFFFKKRTMPIAGLGSTRQRSYFFEKNLHKLAPLFLCQVPSLDTQKR